MKYLILLIALTIGHLSPINKQNPSSYTIYSNYTDEQIKEIQSEARKNLNIKFTVEVVKRNNQKEIVHIIINKYKNLESDVVSSSCESDNFRSLSISPTGCSISDKAN